jgi:hypothetical protein
LGILASVGAGDLCSWRELVGSRCTVQINTVYSARGQHFGLRDRSHSSSVATAYLVFLLGAEFDKGRVHVVQRRCRQVRIRRLGLGLGGRTRRSSGWGRRTRGSRGRTRGRHGRAVQVLQRGLHRSRMRINTVGDHGAIWSGNGCRACWARWCGRGAVRSAGVSIGRKTVGGLSGLSRLGGVGMTA